MAYNNDNTIFQDSNNASTGLGAVPSLNTRDQNNTMQSTKVPWGTPAQEPIEVIRIENVSKTYTIGKQIVPALKNVSLHIGKGEFVAITGPSGSGKSTLLQMIGCLDTPDSGDVFIEGVKTNGLNDGQLSSLRQKSIGFIFQSFYLQPFLRLVDNIALPMMFTSQSKREIKRAVDVLLQEVGLADRSNHFPKELSGGQVQRAAIARALVNTPRILLADEPTGNLDSKNTDSIIELFKAIQRRLGTTVVVVTHDESIAQKADRIINLKDGAIAS